jgi:hypothetical protein
MNAQVLVVWYWQRKIKVVGEKPVPLPLCPPDYMNCHGIESKPPQWQHGNCLPKLWHSHSWGRSVCSSVTGMPIILASMELCINSSFHKDKAQNNTFYMYVNTCKKKYLISGTFPFLCHWHTHTHTWNTQDLLDNGMTCAAPSTLLRWHHLTFSFFWTLKLAVKRRFYVLTMTAEQ